MYTSLDFALRGTSEIIFAYIFLGHGREQLFNCQLLGKKN